MNKKNAYFSINLLLQKSKSKKQKSFSSYGNEKIINLMIYFIKNSQSCFVNLMLLYNAT